MDPAENDSSNGIDLTWKEAGSDIDGLDQASAKYCNRHFWPERWVGICHYQTVGLHFAVMCCFVETLPSLLSWASKLIGPMTHTPMQAAWMYSRPFKTRYLSKIWQLLHLQIVSPVLTNGSQLVANCMMCIVQVRKPLLVCSWYLSISYLQLLLLSRLSLCFGLPVLDNQQLEVVSIQANLAA